MDTNNKPLTLTRRGEIVLGTVAVAGFIATALATAVALWGFTLLFWAAFY